MSNKSSASEQSISLPNRRGAHRGIGEAFSLDLHSETGNFTVPIAFHTGRNGFQPRLNLTHNTGNGNKPFGLGWGLNMHSVSQKTSEGAPRAIGETELLAERDTFLLSSVEDLVSVESTLIRTCCRWAICGNAAVARRLQVEHWKESARHAVAPAQGDPSASRVAACR
jgi:hypothetical protein